VVELKLSYDAFGWSICGILVALKVFSLGKLQMYHSVYSREL